MKTPQKYFSTLQFKTLGISIIGPIIFFGGLILWEGFRNESAPDFYVQYLASIMSLCVAISSAFVIKYKEVPRPGLQSVKGAWAVLQGTIALLISGSGFIFLFYEATVSLLK